MKASGTNTATRTSAIAMIGPDTSRMACTVACRGARPFSIFRSTFSTTTMASSTTIPMARTRPNRLSALIEKPNRCITANVPTIDIGTAISGMIDARHVCRNRMTTRTTSNDRFKQRMDDGLDRSADELGRIVDDLVIHAFRHGQLHLVHRGTNFVGDLDRVGTRCLEDRDSDGALVVEQRAQRIVCCAKFDTGNVAQMRDRAIGGGLDDDLAEFFLGSATVLARSPSIADRHCSS